MPDYTEKLREEFKRKGIKPMGYFIPEIVSPEEPIKEPEIEPVEIEKVSKPWLSTQSTPPIQQIEDYKRGLEKQREKWNRVWDIYYGTIAGKKEEALYNLLVKKYELAGKLDEKDMQRVELLPPKLKEKVLELVGRGEK